MEYTVTHSTSFKVDGSEVANRIERFAEDWKESPLDLLKLVSGVYLDGIKSGLQKAGYPVKDYKEESKEQHDKEH